MKMTNQQIQSAIADLPDNVRKAVITFDWANEILDIGHSHRLHMDQIEAFRHETLMIILGQSSSDNYIGNLKKHLDIKESLAQELVGDANDRIFTELQKRAFKSDDNDEITPETNIYSSSDNYLEPIKHQDLRGPMAKHGVHLIDDEPAFKPQTGLQNEIDQITGTLGTDPEPYESEIHQLHQQNIDTHKTPEIAIDNTSLYQEPFNHDDVPVFDLPTDTTTSQNTEYTQKKHSSKNENIFSMNSGNKNTQTELTHQSKKTTNLYQETIEEEDFKGIPGHRIDTHILKTKNYKTPESIFTQPTIDKSTTKKIPRDLGQGIAQKLDQRIMDNPFIAKNDYVNVSPSEQEQIKEDGNFLESLKNSSE